MAVDWPNHETWAAEKDGITVTTERGERRITVVPCGSLHVPSGRLVACDPFSGMEAGDNPCILVPTGMFPVSVTFADVSEAQDGSHLREAYATIRFAAGTEDSRVALNLVKAGEERTVCDGEDFLGFCVDCGTACFVDDDSIARCMPDRLTWYDELFENSSPDCWFARMDDPMHIRVGIANIPLPLATNGENLILFHSGWGDGVYPVVGSYDKSGNLLAAHIDFFVL